MKRCFKCGEEKSFDEFYKHGRMGDGYLGKCKECTKADTRQNRMAKIEYYRLYDRKRASMPHRIALNKAVQARPHNVERAKRSRKSWELRFPERREAAVKLGNAVRDGKVIPWPVCAIPECYAKPEAHHPDYSQPLQVVWLCSAHHKQAHALMRHYKEAA